MATPNTTISEHPAHLTDPAVALAAELTAADAALDAAENPATEAIGARCDLERRLLRTRPTTPAGAVALLDVARKVHRDQHCSTGQWPDGYEEATSVAMANVAELLRTATWGQLQPAGDDSALFAVERELKEARKAIGEIDELAEPAKHKAADNKIVRLILKLMRTPASTPEGIIAKLMENADILPPDGSKDASFESYMVFHVLRDLRRMSTSTAAPTASGDPQARLLHAQYRDAVARVAIVDTQHKITDEELNEATDPMYEAEDSIPATPGLSLEMLAVKLMTIYAAIRREDQGQPDEATNDGLLQLRALRDELATATGLQVLDPEYPFNQACLPPAGFAQAAE